MTLARFSPTNLLNAVGKYAPGWRGKYPTVKQIAVLRDRDMPLPETRGEASDIMDELATAEGWTSSDS